ncbi:PrsW family intramembrane metalloprotease [Kribbella italica]|uniref:RsiW-degrading membrane proteinase PrsW (M82 family) n=1 Tax=Kribbella italica TaxID=1540520 RepID=A0A7W9MS21_9ACTN|nr:PrsW family glutamic-type intramembrane protease [Kribbella italica]MBB5833463.1 RsiW-degrading membrane proteinase PrsW (M82 family) [Kribbella italica]
MSYPSGGPADAPQPAANGSAGAPYPQPNTLGPHPVPGQRRNRGLLIGIVIAVVFAIAGLLIFGIVAKSVGASGFLWGIGLAFVPIVIIIPLYLWLDRYEPEPVRFLVFALCWGAFIATLAALLINTQAASLLHETTGGGNRAAVFVAPPVEEFAKGSVILLLALVRRKEFDGIIDSLVYAGMVGIGFAFTENILYLGRVFNQLSEEGGSAAGVQGVIGLFILRCVVSPFAHPLFTSCTAIGIGIAVRHRSTAVRFLAPVVGYLTAVLLHGLWNGGASWAGGSGFLTVYLFLMAPLFIAMVVFALVMRSREGQMIASRLYDYVRFGWMNGQDVPLIATLRGRKALRQNAKRYGPQAEAAAKAFQHTATELAYLRDKIVRQVIGADALDTEKKLLDELRARRPSVPFPPMPAFATATPAIAPAGPGAPPYGGPPVPQQGYPGGPGYGGGPQQGGPAYQGGAQQPVYPGGPQQQAAYPGGPQQQGGAQQQGAAQPPYQQPQEAPRGPEQGGGPGVPGGQQPGGYPDGRTGYPSGQPGYPAGRPGYPPGPTGTPGPPGGYGPYPPSQ